MKYNVKTTLVRLAACLCSLAMIAACALIGYFFLPENFSVWASLSVACAAVLLVWLAVNLTVSGIVRKKFENMSVRQAYDYGVKMQRDIERDYIRAERAVRRSLALSYAALAFLVLLTAAASVFVGAMRVAWGIAFLILAWYVALGCFIVWFMPEHSVLPVSRLLLKEKEFPLFYETARRAARKVGCVHPLSLFYSDNGICVLEEGGTAFIGLAPLECSLLTRGELYAAMLHEFAHVVNVDTRRSRRFARGKRRWDNDENNFIEKTVPMFLSSLVTRFFMNVFMYETVATRHHEMMADETVRACGEGRNFVNGVAKGAMLAFYNELPRREMEFDLFESETAPLDYYTRDLKYFLLYRDRYADIWREILANQLPARVASHPTLRQRMETMGEKSYDADTKESDENYAEEQKKLLACGDGKIAELMNPEYGLWREDAYVARKKLMDEYESARAEGKTLPPDEQVRCIQAFYGVEDETALKIADGLAEKGFDSPYVHLFRGKIFFDRMDGRCVEEFRAALDGNGELCDVCLDAIGKYALYSGDEQLLQWYRSESPELAQKAYDREKESVWTKGTPLRRTALPAETLEEIVGRLREMGEECVAVRAYAADFGNGRPCTLIAVEFPSGLHGPLRSKTLNGLYGYLETRAEAFNLRVYGKTVSRALSAAGVAPFWDSSVQPLR